MAGIGGEAEVDVHVRLQTYRPRPALPRHRRDHVEGGALLARLPPELVLDHVDVIQRDAEHGGLEAEGEGDGDGGRVPL